MRILITGGAGFIGSHLVQHFQPTAEEIRVLDNLRSGFRANLTGLRCTFIAGSVLDRDVLRAAMAGVDYVFHLAAMVSVPESMSDPLGCDELNTRGTIMVLEEAARAGVKKLCFSSSAAVYGDDPTVPKREDLPPAPCSPYAITKLDGEWYCQMFTREGRLPTACLRYFNVFGPRQNPKAAYAAAVPIFVQRALRNEPLVIYGDGEQTRDFVDVADVAAANAHFATGPWTGVYNVARGGQLTINQLVAHIRTLTGSTSPVVHAAPRPGDVRHSTAAITRLLATGFQPQGELAVGLPRVIAHLRGAPAGQ